MKLYRFFGLIAICLVVYYANTGNTAFTVLYCFILDWYRDWMIREKESKDEKTDN